MELTLTRAAAVLWLAGALVPLSAGAQAGCTVPSAGCAPRTLQGATAVRPPDRAQPIGPLKPTPFGPLKLAYPGTRPEPDVARDFRAGHTYSTNWNLYGTRQTWIVPVVRPIAIVPSASAFGGVWAPYATYQPSEHDLWAREWWRRPLDGVPLDSAARVRTSSLVVQREPTARELEHMREQRRFDEATITILSGMQPSALVEAARGAARQRCLALKGADEQRSCLTGVDAR